MKEEIRGVYFSHDQLQEMTHPLYHLSRYKGRSIRIDYPLTGYADLALQENEALWALLWYGQWIQCGKWTGIGLGRYFLENIN